MPTGKKKDFFKIKKIYKFKLIIWLYKCMQLISKALISSITKI